MSNDLVNSPSHYNAGGIECIDAIEAALTPEEFKGFLKGQVMKYLWRGPYKGAEQQDHQKAMWYLDRLLKGASPAGKEPLARKEAEPLSVEKSRSTHIRRAVKEYLEESERQATDDPS